MSHQTGIRASDELKAFFAKCMDDSGSVRIFRVIIKDEKLVLDRSGSPKGSWEEDYDIYIPSFCEASQPCYVFYRLDSTNESGFEWIFLSWSPDSSPVRQKMLYASTKATLKKEFGSGRIKHEIFAVQKEEVSLKSYKSGKGSSVNESDQRRKKSAETIHKAIEESLQTVQGVPFPVSDNVLQALNDMKHNRLKYIQLSVDVEKEEINLAFRGDLDVASISEKVPEGRPRYHLLKFPHSYNGEFLESTVFIHTVPGYSCPVKERMIYSTCKAPLLTAIEKGFGIEITKKIEIDSNEKLTESLLTGEIHVTDHSAARETAPKFDKPKGPPRRGPMRLLKNTTHE